MHTLQILTGVHSSPQASPDCGNADVEKIAKGGWYQAVAPSRPFYCNECKGQFTITIGTVFERSEAPLTTWWMAAHMFDSGRKWRLRSRIYRVLGVTYKTAWFTMRRLREAMSGAGSMR